MLCRICTAQIQPPETSARSCRLYGSHAVIWAVHHTDQGCICPEIFRSWTVVGIDYLHDTDHDLSYCVIVVSIIAQAVVTTAAPSVRVLLHLDTRHMLERKAWWASPLQQCRQRCTAVPLYRRLFVTNYVASVYLVRRTVLQYCSLNTLQHPPYEPRSWHCPQRGYWLVQTHSDDASSSPDLSTPINSFFLFFFKSSGGWVKIKLKLPHFHSVSWRKSTPKLDPRGCCTANRSGRKYSMRFESKLYIKQA